MSKFKNLHLYKAQLLICIVLFTGALWSYENISSRDAEIFASISIPYDAKSIKEAIALAEPGSRILLTDAKYATFPIMIDKDELTFECSPGMRLYVPDGETVFIDNAVNTWIKGCGFANKYSIAIEVWKSGPESKISR